MVFVGDRPELTKEIVMEWLKTTDGRWFTTVQMDKDLSIGSPKAKGTRRVILYRYTKENILEKHRSREGLYRLRQDNFEELDFKTADTNAYLPILLPFNLHDYVRFYAKNIVVVAGTSNAGKTAFMFNVIRLNEPYFADNTYYFTSEMGKEELADRLLGFEDADINSWRFKAMSLDDNFADAIKPDGLNIIDYWEFKEGEFYKIADDFREIIKRLNKGMCFVALQKKKGAELGRAAELGLEKARLYLTIDPGLLTVIKGKKWANKEINPNGMKIRFKLYGGANFVQISEPFWPDRDKQ